METKSELDKYTEDMQKLIDEINNEIYKKTFIPKLFNDINYKTLDTTCIKFDNSCKNFSEIAKYYSTGIPIIDPYKSFKINIPETLSDEDIQDMKFDLIENNLIKVSKFTLFKHWLIKKWYIIKFIFYMIRIKLKLK